MIQETVRAYTRGWYADVVTELPRIENGRLYPLTGPGLGTRLKPSFLASDAVLRRRSALAPGCAAKADPSLSSQRPTQPLPLGEQA